MIPKVIHYCWFGGKNYCWMLKSAFDLGKKNALTMK